MSSTIVNFLLSLFAVEYVTDRDTGPADTLSLVISEFDSSMSSDSPLAIFPQRIANAVTS